jgi:hypothetical protein
MRYVLYRMPVEPTDTNSPVGMNDILGIGEYISPQNAMRYMRPPPGTVDRCVNGLHESKWLGLYTLPRMQLVHKELL